MGVGGRVFISLIGKHDTQKRNIYKTFPKGGSTNGMQKKLFTKI